MQPFPEPSYSFGDYEEQAKGQEHPEEAHPDHTQHYSQSYED